MRELNIRITADDTDARAKLGATERDVKGVTTEASKMETAMRAAGAAIGAAFSVQKIAQMSGQVLQTSGRIVDLSAKLGISTAAVQELDFAATQSGGSLEQVSTAISLMGQRLTEGGTGVVGALKSMGLELSALQAMAPDQAFTAIATGVAGIEDPMVRSQVAMELFGRSGASLLPLLTSDIAGLRQTAQEMGIVLEDDVVRSAEATGDAFEAMQLRVNAAKANALLPVLNLFTSLPQPIQTTLGVANEFSGVLSGLAMAVMAAGGPVAALGFVKGALIAIGTVATGPIGIVVAAITGLGLIWYAWGDDIKRWTGEAIDWVWEKFAWFRDQAVGLWEQLTGFLGQTVTEMRRQFGLIPTALLPLLGPIGAVLAAFRHWDAITRIAQAVYTGVRTWLLDRFTAVVDSIKRKVDAVTGFFGDMYDAVVGNSFVPDMITGIMAEFSKLDAGMVAPTRTATDTAKGLFAGLQTDVTNTLTTGFSNWITGAGSFRDIFSGIFGSVRGGVQGVLSGMLGDLRSTLSNMLSTLISSGGSFQAAWKTILSGGGSGGYGGSGMGGNDPTMIMASAWLDAALGPHFISPEAQAEMDRAEAIRMAEYTGAAARAGMTPEEFIASGGIPGFAEGGIVPATPGGRIVRVAEAGQAEAIIPLDRLEGGSGRNVEIHLHLDQRGSVIDRATMDRFVSDMLPSLAHQFNRLGLAR